MAVLTALRVKDVARIVQLVAYIVNNATPPTAGHVRLACMGQNVTKAAIHTVNKCLDFRSVRNIAENVRMVAKMGTGEKHVTYLVRRDVMMDNVMKRQAYVYMAVKRRLMAPVVRCTFLVQKMRKLRHILIRYFIFLIDVFLQYTAQMFECWINPL